MITFDEPEDASKYVFMMSTDYYLHLLDEVYQHHKKNGAKYEAKIVKSLIDGFKQIGNA